MLTFREKIGKFLFENRPLIALVLFVVAGCGAYLMKLSSDRYDSERLTTAAERYLRKGMTRDARHSLQLALKFDEDNQRARELLVQLADTGEDEPEPAGIAAQASEEEDPAGP